MRPKYAYEFSLQFIYRACDYLRMVYRRLVECLNNNELWRIRTENITTLLNYYIGLIWGVCILLRVISDDACDG
jgi:hypothetical protein